MGASSASFFFRKGDNMKCEYCGKEYSDSVLPIHQAFCGGEGSKVESNNLTDNVENIVSIENAMQSEIKTETEDAQAKKTIEEVLGELKKKAVK